MNIIFYLISTPTELINDRVLSQWLRDIFQILVIIHIIVTPRYTYHIRTGHPPYIFGSTVRDDASHPNCGVAVPITGWIDSGSFIWAGFLINTLHFFISVGEKTNRIIQTNNIKKAKEWWIWEKKKPQPSPGPLPHFNISFIIQPSNPHGRLFPFPVRKWYVDSGGSLPPMPPPKLLYAVCAAGIGPSIASCGAGICQCPSFSFEFSRSSLGLVD